MYRFVTYRFVTYRCVTYRYVITPSFTLDEGALGLEDTLDLQGMSISRPYNW